MIVEISLKRVITYIIVACAQLSCVQLFATPWTVACQAPLSMGFLRQEYWSGLPFLSPGESPQPRDEHSSLHWQVDSLPPGKPKYIMVVPS